MVFELIPTNRFKLLVNFSKTKLRDGKVVKCHKSTCIFLKKIVTSTSVPVYT